MTTHNPLLGLTAILEEDYNDCIAVVEHGVSVSGVHANVRLHHLKFDGNGRPMVAALAEMLFRYIIDYCIASKNRGETLTPRQATQLTKEARSLFRHPAITEEDPDKTGEAGEALLFFLSEAVLRAPQLVAKMELKTNHKDEVKGSDGIHAKWHEDDKIVDFYFGESKLYKDIGSAITSAINSIDAFHETKMYKHEFAMVTKHFKYANEQVKQEISDLIKTGEPSSGARINHACLIGYDWDEYSKIDLSVGGKKLHEEFQEKLEKDAPRIAKLLEARFSKFAKKHLRFEVFFIPFPSVTEFRNAFNEALD